MSKLLIAGIAATTAAAVGTPAQASPTYHYAGGCEYYAISDGTNSSSTRWTGEVHAVAAATAHGGLVDEPAAVSIQVDCELRVNGESPGSIVLKTPTDVGVTANATRFEFVADPDDVVTTCDNVTVGGEFHKVCTLPSPTLPPVPQPIQDLVEDAIWTLEEPVCDHLAAESGGPADRPPAFDIRSDGDVYVDGEWYYDCPPYGTSGS